MGWEIQHGDWIERLREMPDESVHCVVTSPPYWGLRDYGVPGQLGLEKTPEEYIRKVVEGFREVRRVLRKDGTIWLNVGDSYTSGGRDTHGTRIGYKQETNGGCLSVTEQRPECPDGLKPKDLVGIPWMAAFALRGAGWYLRTDIIWAKPNGMPGSQQDRCTSSHEHIFHLSRSKHYWSDFDAIKTPPRESTMVRLAQDVQAQAGSHRANGGAKTNGPMKAVAQRTDKQRGHSRRHDGFNDRWDAMDKAEQQSQPAMMRDVWFVAPATFDEAHFAVMPEEIARRCILAGCRHGGTVLDPFAGAGTTGLVATRFHRNFIGIELKAEYADMARRRITQDAPLFNTREQRGEAVTVGRDPEPSEPGFTPA